MIAVLLVLETACTKSAAIVVASGERKVDSGSVRSFGYRVKQLGKDNDAVQMEIYGDTFFFKLEAPHVRFSRMVKQEWLCNDRVLYLQLETVTRGESAPATVQNQAILYDFFRTRLYLRSESFFWTVLELKTDIRRSRKNAAEFDSRLALARAGCME